MRLSGLPAIKIGYSADPIRRLDSLVNYHRKNGVLLAHVPGKPSMELLIHEQLEPCTIGNELFLPCPALDRLLIKYGLDPVIEKKYERRNANIRAEKYLLPS